MSAQCLERDMQSGGDGDVVAAGPGGESHWHADVGHAGVDDGEVNAQVEICAVKVARLGTRELELDED